jgi:polyribonucleotide nucleotidyltransferase
VGGKRVENVEDVLQVGQKVQVEIAEIDPRGKLSLHAVVDDADEAAPAAESGSDDAKGADGEGRPERQRRDRRRERHTHPRNETAVEE